jgi:hypothetical protein
MGWRKNREVKKERHEETYKLEHNLWYEMKIDVLM